MLKLALVVLLCVILVEGARIRVSVNVKEDEGSSVETSPHEPLHHNLAAAFLNPALIGGEKNFALSKVPSPLDTESELDDATGIVNYKIPNVPYWNQEDPRWAKDTYFTGYSNLFTIGCTLSAVAMSVDYSTGDSKWNPHYVNAGHWGEAVNMLKTTNLGPFTDLYYQKPAGLVTPNSAGFNKVNTAILNSIKSGHLVLIGMEFSPSLPDGTARHTVLGMGYTSQGHILIHDPAGGDLKDIHHYWDMKQFHGLDLALQVNNKLVKPVRA